MSTQEPPDLYRDTYVRYLGYANEVGEAFRALVHVNVVRFSYVVACSYVIADANHKGQIAAKKSDESNVTKNRMIAMADTVVWQGLASVAIPGFTINRLCAGTNYMLKKTASLPVGIRRWTTTFVGLGCIPFIVKPIDHSVDFMMNNSLRKMYVAKPEPKGVFHHERAD
ncbi:mitochondrial fission process protein 1 [Octopus bimaculoides]|uniref:Mitochondrial fission process protein 1 n=1 Tax=Octopus bimaculoides TaxID=37653 RepID=A0A0L8HN92_OCTBM|nr:mitochondrial fission process protein 1 [Octopus bimaculoides]|eukprot:XP_014770858.1 PREDICTED: mitochondrial fission process protein 1-like [Octopus bimaculoides]